MEMNILKREGNKKIQVTLSEFFGRYYVTTIDFKNGSTIDSTCFNTKDTAENHYYYQCDLNGVSK